MCTLLTLLCLGVSMHAVLLGSEGILEPTAGDEHRGVCGVLCATVHDAHANMGS